MGYLHPNLDEDDVLTLLDQATGFLSREAIEEASGAKGRTYLVPEAGLAVEIRPGGGRAPWPAHVGALFGDRPNGGVRALARVTELLQCHGGLPVPSILHFGEGTGPGGSDFTIVEIPSGRPFDWAANRLGHHACHQLGEHLGRLHAATAQADGFGILDGDPTRWTQWWPRFAVSYTILANDLCDVSPVLRGFRSRLDGPLERAVRSPDPRAFPLVCVDQTPTRYLGDDEGHLAGFVDVEDHLYAPAEWELTTLGMWLAHPHAFRNGYEVHRGWPDFMEDVRDAYATYTLLEWIARARDRTSRPEDVADLEAWLVGTFA